MSRRRSRPAGSTGSCTIRGAAPRIYLDCAKAAGVLERALAPVHFCLSPQVAEPLLAAGAGKVRIAPSPEETALINLVVSKWPS